MWEATRTTNPCLFCVTAASHGWQVEWMDYQHGGDSADYLATHQLDIVGTGSTFESHFLVMQYAFEQPGYRHYEWKRDSLNAPSRKAAFSETAA